MDFTDLEFYGAKKDYANYVYLNTFPIKRGHFTDCRQGKLKLKDFLLNDAD